MGTNATQSTLCRSSSNILLYPLYSIRRVPLGQPPECDVLCQELRDRKGRMNQHLTNAAHVLPEPDTDTANSPRRLIFVEGYE